MRLAHFAAPAGHRYTQSLIFLRPYRIHVVARERKRVACHGVRASTEYLINVHPALRKAKGAARKINLPDAKTLGYG